MNGKETANALELRALATKLAKASGKWAETDMPGRNILVFEDGDLQLENKVFSVRWKRGDVDAEIELCKHGDWEARLKQFAANMRLRPVK